MKGMRSMSLNLSVIPGDRRSPPPLRGSGRG